MEMHEYRCNNVAKYDDRFCGQHFGRLTDNRRSERRRRKAIARDFITRPIRRSEAAQVLAWFYDKGGIAAFREFEMGSPEFQS
jgi:hypothetical protein